jgi:signal transduction histidine kinase
MSTHTLTDAIDARVVFKVYAGTAWAAGTFLCAWGPRVFPLELVALPHGAGFFVRVVGVTLWAVGFFAYAASKVEEPPVQRQMLTWWALGHTIAIVPAINQAVTVIRDPGPGTALALTWLILWLYVFWYARLSFDGVPWAQLQTDHQTLFGDLRQPSVAELRSAYEERIRAAAAQEERNRLARDLHDSIKQEIFVIHTAAATAEARLESDPAGTRAAIEQVRSSAREAMTEMEVMLDQLRASPLENAGLVEALKKQCDALRFRTGADVHLTVGDLPPDESLPPGTHEAVFRVAQEALANIGRHARASHVTVMLDASPLSFQLRVDDDGAGFDNAATGPGMGLGNMRTRAAALGGTLAVATEPGKGTLIRMSVPRIEADASNVKSYERRVYFWGAGLLFWIFVVGLGIIYPSQRWDLIWRVPFMIVHLWIAFRVRASYLRVRRIYREQLGKAGPA